MSDKNDMLDVGIFLLPVKGLLPNCVNDLVVSQDLRVWQGTMRGAWPGQWCDTVIQLGTGHWALGRTWAVGVFQGVRALDIPPYHFSVSLMLEYVEPLFAFSHFRIFPFQFSSF
jgi:hypothetical protein